MGGNIACHKPVQMQSYTCGPQDQLYIYSPFFLYTYFHFHVKHFHIILYYTQIYSVLCFLAYQVKYNLLNEGKTKVYFFFIIAYTSHNQIQPQP